MTVVDLIERKRNGGRLEAGELAAMMRDYAAGRIPDYQMSAFAMAVYFRGMDDVEIEALTTAMLESGRTLELGHLGVPRVDKHSTGGVGDKTSLILAPIAAACGVPVPMVSGRGLGHTGGTLDKLESIPGFDVRLDLDRYKAVLADCGLVLIGQTDEIAPADRTLYALRDATATVESIPLITASILSKKLAEGIDGLVLDVKFGDGAFMARLEDARTLAETMCAIGRRLGKQVVALITRMDQPLGRAVGNAVEVIESVECLRGQGPEDLTSLSIELAAEMVVLGGHAGSLDEARAQCRRTIDDGTALERFRRLVSAQGGDPKALDDVSRLPAPRSRHELPSPRSGVVHRLAARTVGEATMKLGAGRARVDSTIDPSVGVILHKKVGDPVTAGEPLCTILANDDEAIRELAAPMLVDSYTIGDGPIDVPSLIVDRL